MTSLDTLKKSRQDSRPVEFYHFVLGSQTSYFTSAEDDITLGGNVYIAERGLQRSAIVKGSDSATRNVLVTVPSTNAFAARFISIPPGERATIRIFQGERDEVPAWDTLLLMFTGLVQSVRFSNNGLDAEIVLRGLETALNQIVPRVTFSGQCNNFLYDQNCGVEPASFNLVGLVTAESGVTITVAGVGASPLKFTGGFVRPVSAVDFRQIISVSGDVLTLDVGFPQSYLNENLQVFAGCDHNLTGDCALVFDNVEEFLGFHYVPNKNVFSTGLDA